jgi:hypothetical protein
MQRDFLLPQRVVTTDGIGLPNDLRFRCEKQKYLTLGVTRLSEHHNLEVSLWGSSDCEDWGSEPLATFPAKFSCGIYSILLDFSAHTEIWFVRVQWKIGHWGKSQPMPMCEFYVCTEEVGTRSRAAVR